ncbi:hypothetical protein AAMO2058_000205600 [Amorphochlora amoebiformis]|mmetsp:Transcript_11330/g.17903  ORF Transcript_11330/g.17903 Transcript_11330/m.17903 type:complete len:1804 (-) Transcript_11330:100-5511(-)
MPRVKSRPVRNAALLREKAERKREVEEAMRELPLFGFQSHDERSDIMGQMFTQLSPWEAMQKDAPRSSHKTEITDSTSQQIDDLSELSRLDMLGESSSSLNSCANVCVDTKERRQNPNKTKSRRVTRANVKNGLADRPFGWVGDFEVARDDLVRSAGDRLGMRPQKKKRRLISKADAEKRKKSKRPQSVSKKLPAKKTHPDRVLKHDEISYQVCSLEISLFDLPDASEGDRKEHALGEMKTEWNLQPDPNEHAPGGEAKTEAFVSRWQSDSLSFIFGEKSVKKGYRLHIRGASEGQELAVRGSMEYLLPRGYVSGFLSRKINSAGTTSTRLRICVCEQAIEKNVKQLHPEAFPEEKLFHRHLRLLLLNILGSAYLREMKSGGNLNDDIKDSGEGSKSKGLIGRAFAELKAHRKESWGRSERNFHQHKDVLPKLRRYQLQASRWMEKRENLDELAHSSTIPLHPMWEMMQSWEYRGALRKSSAKLYWNRCTGHITPIRVSPPPQVKGGILAEEMGLGKTIETLHLICARRCPLEELSVPQSLPSSKFENDEEDPACCVCQRLYSESRKGQFWVQCDHCKSWHHSKCVSHDRVSKNQSDPKSFCCPFCWRQRCEEDPVKAKTTLIISPSAIVGQWATEIKCHTREGALSVYRYDGLRGDSACYVPPSELAKYDVVLTTYSVLRAELHHARGAAFERKGFRYRRRRRAAPSPLMDINWWRVVIDEAQMAESTTAHAAQMCRQIRCRYRWSVTGTPINKSIDDLWGLLLFLKAYPYAHRYYWQRDILEPLDQRNEWNSALRKLGECVGPIFWRKTKEEVGDELGLPGQEETVVEVQFSEVELYNYQRLADDCEGQARRVLQSFGHLVAPKKARTLKQHIDKKATMESKRNSKGEAKQMEEGGDIKIVDAREENGSSRPKRNRRLGRDAASALLSSLLSLRQACCHPMLGRAANRAFARSSESLLSLQRRRQTTLDSFLRQLIVREEKECTQAVRERAVSTNGLAGIAYLEGDMEAAAEFYTDTLELANTKTLWITSDPRDSSGKGTGKSMVDKLLQLHATHHLRALLEESNTLKPPARLTEGHLSEIFCRGTSNSPEKHEPPLGSPEPLRTPTKTSSGSCEVMNLCRATAARRKRLRNLGSPQDPKVNRYGRGKRVQKQKITKTLEHIEHELRKGYINTELHRVAQTEMEAVKKCQRTMKAWRETGWDGPNPWWLEALTNIGSNANRAELFVGRVVDELAARSAGVSTSLLDRVRTIDGLQYVVANTLDRLRAAREKFIKELQRLYAPEGPSLERILKTGNCRICAVELGRKGPTCDHCKCLRLAGEYEGLIFQTRFVGIGEAGVTASNYAAYLETEGKRVDAQQESEVFLILRILNSVGAIRRRKTKTSPCEWIESIKKEYHALGAWWRAQKDELDNLDELEMSLLRIRIRERGEKVSEHEKNFVVEKYKLGDLKQEFKLRIQETRTRCAKKVGQLFFLRSLSEPKQKENEDPGDIDSSSNIKMGYECPICLTSITAKKSGMIVFNCGHVVCYKCGIDLLQFAQKRQHAAAAANKAVKVHCPKCRCVTSDRDLGYVERRTEAKNSADLRDSPLKNKRFARETSDMFGAKIQAVLARVLRLKTRDPGVKIVIFSQWQEVLSLLADALGRYGVEFEMPKTSRKDFHRAIERFKNRGPVDSKTTSRRKKRKKGKEKDPAQPSVCSALLLQLKSGGQGLNLTEATHVMFVDPSLNPAQHLQAAGRVHRIGQNRHTYVHWFLTKDSIEQNIYRIHCRRRKDAKIGLGTGSKEQESLSVDDIGTLLSTETRL